MVGTAIQEGPINRFSLPAAPGPTASPPSSSAFPIDKSESVPPSSGRRFDSCLSISDHINDTPACPPSISSSDEGNATQHVRDDDLTAACGNPAYPVQSDHTASSHSTEPGIVVERSNDFTSELPPAPESFQSTVKSFRSHRHRKTYSIDSVPRQTIMKALVSRPPPTSNMSIATSLNELLGCQDKFLERSHQSQQLSEALADLQLNEQTLSASKMAALASPCFFHKKFDGAVNIERVLEEISDDCMSHSRLMQTATGVREVSRQLQRRPIKMSFRNIMIITKARDNELVHLTRELAEWLLTTPRYGSDVGVNVYVDKKLSRSKRFDAKGLLAMNPQFENMLRYWTPELCWSSPEKFDLVLTLGGDGTVLYTSWLFQRIVPPIMSFSLGSLGFLTNFEFPSYKQNLNHVMGDSGMRVNLRMRFTCTVYRYSPVSPASDGSDETAAQATHIEGEQFEVLNELVIDRGPSPYVSQLELYGDNSLITTIMADGCIFSTPTGSTAYSLSAGGSLVHPDIPAILLTPICPHTLSFRPMLLNDTMLLRIAVPKNSRATAYCAFDGKGRVELRQGDHVTIAASQYPFPTVLSRPTEWFDSISRTLRWNTRGAQQKAWDGAKHETDIPENAKEPEFDIDFDDDDKDSGYSGEGSSVGGTVTPLRRGTLA
jgi:NAD+ kinase